MWQVTDRFLKAITGSPRLVTVVDVLDQGETVLTGIPVSDGQVVRDRTAANFGRCNLTVAAPDLAPLEPLDQLGPAGFEVAVSCGFEYPDGTRELVPIIVAGIQDATVDGTTLTTSIEAVDRSQRIADALLESDRRFTNTTPSLVVETLAPEIIPDVEIDTSGATPAESGFSVTYDAGSDVWAIFRDVAKANGRETYFDGMGRLIVRDEPDLTTSNPVWTVVEGNGGALLTVDLAWSRRPSHNRAIVTGTNTEFGVLYRAVATDNAPASPSYYSGRFGPKPILFHSPHVASNADAAKAAAAILKAKQGVAMSLDLTAVPNPALEPGDVVIVQRDSLGLNLPVILDAITIDWGPEAAMTCNVRARQEEDIE